MKEALYNDACTFRETFNSEYETRKNGGIPTNVVFNKGSGEFNGTGFVKYPNIKLADTFSVRFKGIIFDAGISGVLNGLLSANNYEFWLSSTGKLSYYNGVAAKSDTTTLVAGVKYDIVFVYDGTNINFYIDKLLSSSSIVAKHALDIGSTYIGCYFPENENLNATVEAVEIYNRALTPSEVSNLYDNKTYHQVPKAEDIVTSSVLEMSKTVAQVSSLNGSLIDEAFGQEVGSNIVVNGSFTTDSDWIKETGWTISGGKAHCDIASGYNSIHQNYTGFELGELYSTEFDATVENGLCTYTLSHNFRVDNRLDITETGHYKCIQQVREGAAITQIRFQSQGGFKGTIDNVVVKRIRNDFTELKLLEIIKDSCFATKFNGYFSYIDMGVDFLGVDNFSVYGWIKPFSSGGNGWGTIITNGEFYLSMGNGTRLGTKNNNIAGSPRSPVGSVPYNEWTFFSLTRIGIAGINSLYLGNLDTAPVLDPAGHFFGGIPAASTSNVLIGDMPMMSYAFDGLIPFIGVKDRLITSEQMSQIWASTRQFIGGYSG